MTQIGEEAETEVPRTGRSQGRGRSQGGGLPVSSAGNRGTSRRTSDTSEGIKGEPTVSTVEQKKISEKRGTSAIATSEELLLLITEESELHLVSDETTWVVDSGASYHLTPNRKCFSSYKAGDHNVVKMGNEGTCRIVGIGDMCLTTSIGCKLLLKDVRHVPEVHLSLLSADQLDDEGYTGVVRNPSLCADREAEPPGFWTGRIRSPYKL